MPLYCRLTHPTAFLHWNAGVVSSTTIICVFTACVSVVPCVGSGLVTCYPFVHGTLPCIKQKQANSLAFATFASYS
jgi:hypothetical protein